MAKSNNNSIKVAPTFDRLNNALQKFSFNRKQQRIFLEDLSILIFEGVAPSQAITILSETTEGIRQTVAKEINDRLAEGLNLADGMRAWFCNVVTEIISAGENSGTLAEAIRASLDTLNDMHSARMQVINTITYPTSVFTLALALTVFIKHSVLDSFLKIRPLSLWPSSGIHLFHFAEIVQDWWWLFLLILVGGVFFILRLLRDLTGDIRTLLDSMPLIGLYRDALAARFMQMLGRMLNNGVLLKNALQILQKDAEPYLIWHITLMEFNLSGGNENLADMLNTHLIPRDDLMRLRVVSRTRGFAHALINLGAHARKRVNQRALNLSRILSTLLFIASGTIAAATVFAIYSIGSTLAAYS